MSTFESMWAKFKRNKRYRDAFVAQHAKTEIGFQIRALLKQFGLTQKQLADRSGLTQGVVSRAADPSYGNLTVNTLVRIAAGFDVAFVGRFVPFSELPKWSERRKVEPFTVSTFEQEDAALAEQATAATALESYRGAQVGAEIELLRRQATDTAITDVAMQMSPNSRIVYTWVSATQTSLAPVVNLAEHKARYSAIGTLADGAEILAGASLQAQLGATNAR